MPTKKITFTVEYDAGKKEVKIVPPGGSLTCAGEPEYSVKGRQMKEKFRNKLISDLELWDQEGEDPCVSVGGRLYCW